MKKKPSPGTRLNEGLPQFPKRKVVPVYCPRALSNLNTEVPLGTLGNRIETVLLAPSSGLLARENPGEVEVYKSHRVYGIHGLGEGGGCAGCHQQPGSENGFCFHVFVLSVFRVQCLCRREAVFRQQFFYQDFALVADS